jgi:hypothetical protein
VSRSGRPNTRGAHKRNLVGPNEVLRRLEEQGGVPAEVVAELTAESESNPRVEAANEAAVAAIRAAREQIKGTGVQYETYERADLPDSSVERDMAWMISVTTAMKESAPRKTWCRHMRAADPRLSEIRTVATLSAGVWLCFECLRQAGLDVLKADPWPSECDLCGATIEQGEFNNVSFNIPGCMVNAAVCNDCADFQRSRAK